MTLSVIIRYTRKEGRRIKHLEIVPDRRNRSSQRRDINTFVKRKERFEVTDRRRKRKRSEAKRHFARLIKQ